MIGHQAILTSTLLSMKSVVFVFACALIALAYVSSSSAAAAHDYKRDVQTAIASHDVVLYGKSYCPYCKYVPPFPPSSTKCSTPLTSGDVFEGRKGPFSATLTHLLDSAPLLRFCSPSGAPRPH